MWGVIIAIIFGLALITALYFAIAPLVGVAAVTNQLSHLTDTFKFIIGNIKTMSEIFPWAIDVVIIFGVILIVETVMLIIRIFAFFSQFLLKAK